MKKAGKLAALALGAVMILSGCGSSASTTKGTKASGSSSAISASGSASASSSAEKKSGKKKVALILPGKKDDVSFNQAMYDGMEQYAKDHPDEIDLKVVENVYEVSDIEPTLLDFADQGYDVIFGHGFQFMEPIVKVAPQYPKTDFILGTGNESVDNSAIYDVQLESGGYLMGVIAALATKTGKIGVVGGADAAEIYRGHEGFKLGAKSVNPNIQIQEVYTGDWTDTAGAKEAAIGMYDSGVDVIWHSGDGIGLGVVQAAKEKDKYCLGNVADQKSLAPDNVLSGVVYEWEPVIAKIFDDINSGKFTGRAENDRYYWINAENGGLKYAPINDPKGYLTDDDKKQIEDTYQKLKNGEINITIPEQKKK
jgi:basic membrane protein A